MKTLTDQRLTLVSYNPSYTLACTAISTIAQSCGLSNASNVALFEI